MAASISDGAVPDLNFTNMGTVSSVDATVGVGDVTAESWADTTAMGAAEMKLNSTRSRARVVHRAAERRDRSPIDR